MLNGTFRTVGHSAYVGKVNMDRNSPEVLCELMGNRQQKIPRSGFYSVKH